MTHLHGGMLSLCLDFGFLVSGHIDRGFPDTFKIWKVTSPSTVEGAEECSHATRPNTAYIEGSTRMVTSDPLAFNGVARTICSSRKYQKCGTFVEMRGCVGVQRLRQYLPVRDAEVRELSCPNLGRELQDDARRPARTSKRVLHALLHPSMN